MLRPDAHIRTDQHMTTTTSSTASITSLGVGSGLDLESILESLEESKTTSLLDPITAQEESVEAEISAYGTLTSALDTLQSAAEALADASLYESLSTSISGSGVAVTTSSEAVAGTYSIEVTQLAQAQSLATDGFDGSGWDVWSRCGFGFCSVSWIGWNHCCGRNDDECGAIHGAAYCGWSEYVGQPWRIGRVRIQAENHRHRCRQDC